MSTAVQPAPTPSTPSESSSSPEPSDEERERIVRQLEQLERKQAELRRALIVADHPTLAGPIREVDGRVYGVQLASDRLDAPLSKSEQKKLERLAKKIDTLRAKRDELDRSIAELEKEHAELGDERTATLEAQRQEALNNLLTTMAEHAPAFDEAGLQISELIPELERWLPTLRAMAEEKVSD